jgi:hypothetical protein
MMKKQKHEQFETSDCFFRFVFFSIFFFSRSPPTSGGWLFSKNISAGNEKKPPLQGCANPTKKKYYTEMI